MTSTLLDEVEPVLATSLDRLPEPGRSGARRVVLAGGKRLRPDLLLRSAQLLPERPLDLEPVVAAAAAVELLHSATLLHDDLLDGSEIRRGVPAVHRREGMAAAVIGGDALIAQSWRLIARCGPANVEELADALADMCAGEALEEELTFATDAAPLDVLRVAQLKTGALLRAACRIGARLGGCGEAQVQAMGTFGSDFGIALQLIDDVLDVVSTPSLLGKPCGADFAAGTVTMPTVFAFESTSGEGAVARAAELRQLLRADLNADDAARARELVSRSPGPQRTIELARSFARRAAKAVPLVSASAAAVSALPLEFVERQLATKTDRLNRWITAPDDRNSDDGMCSPVGDVG